MHIDMRRHHLSKYAGFTLVELLVVIAIIALLLSILMPTLRLARFQARRIICLNDVNQLYTVQMLYSMNNDGKFALHYSCSPDYKRVYGMSKSLVWESMHDYLENWDIVTCPLVIKLYGGFNNYYVSSNGNYGGWDAINPYTGEAPGWIADHYFWYANFKYYGTTQTLFLDGEPPWPTKASECTSSKAFMSHRICITTTVGWADDYSHGGGGREPYTGEKKFTETNIDTPVGQADGSVIMRKKNQIKYRAIFGEWEIMY